MPRRTLAVFLTPILLLLACGCGSGSKTSVTSGSSSAAGANPAAESGGTLAADARSAATGDIPDSQNFLIYSDVRLGISMLYPEGWTVRQAASGVSIEDKNNLVRISLSRGSAPTTASVQAQLAALMRSSPGLGAEPPRMVSLKSGPAVKVTYTTQSAANPVTGKRVTLTVDRYEFAHTGRVATVDLGTPVGVDNVDAYRRMSESFKWR